MSKKLPSSVFYRKARVMAVASVLMEHYAQIRDTPTMAIDDARSTAQAIVGMSACRTHDCFMAHFALGRLRAGDTDEWQIASRARAYAKTMASDIEAMS